MQFPETNFGSDQHQFLKLKDNESVKGVFRGEMKVFAKHWVDKQSEWCKGEGCPLCRGGSKPKFSFRINFVVNENGTYVAKIWEQGKFVFEDLKALNEEIPLEKQVIKVTRKGSTLNDTRYIVTPVPNGLVSEALEKTLSAVTLCDLNVQPTKDFQQPLPESKIVQASNEEWSETIPF